MQPAMLRTSPPFGARGRGDDGLRGRGRARFAGHALVGPAVTVAAMVALTAGVATVDPGVPGRYPVCPFFALTGRYCPGCGGLRAVHALAHGELTTALDLNAFVVAALPVAVVAWLLWVRRRLRRSRGEPASPGIPSAWSVGLAIAVAVLGIAFAVLRNLPAFAVLAP